jgi:hypothetical protein
MGQRKGPLMRKITEQSDILMEAAGTLSDLQDTIFEASRELDRLYNLLRDNAELTINLKVKNAEDALNEIKNKHQNYEEQAPTEYGRGVVDGHRCAANVAKRYFDGEGG